MIRRGAPRGANGAGALLVASPIIFLTDNSLSASAEGRRTLLPALPVLKWSACLLIRDTIVRFRNAHVGHKTPPNLVETLPGPLQDSYMTGKSMTEEKKHPAAPAVERVGANKRAKVAVSSPIASKKIKTSPDILTEDARYELARKEAEARVVRHDLRDRLRGRS
jgi:hypothetical protein